MCFSLLMQFVVVVMFVFVVGIVRLHDSRKEGRYKRNLFLLESNLLTEYSELGETLSVGAELLLVGS